MLKEPGRWIAVLPYQGDQVYLLFSHWQSARPEWVRDEWRGPTRTSWRSSLNADGYRDAVERTREAIARGDVYQANICRVLSSKSDTRQSLLGLFDRVVTGNPAPYAAIVHAPEIGIEIVCASPELFLRRDGQYLVSGPIKGTATTESDLLDKDSAENIMIVDLVRNDLSQVCLTGSVEVPRLLEVEEHPGLVHLVSQVSGELEPGTSWAEILAATFPPGSVTGAPKSAALRIISEHETSPRDLYCGALGWIEHGGEQAELAVTIRTFWRDGAIVKFGTGAGITWESDAHAEWLDRKSVV